MIDEAHAGIAELNPFRYRSYYYDPETHLYYLNTRYYDPEVGRFISADNIEYLEFDSLGVSTLYNYCNNNPVMYVDDGGAKAKKNKFRSRKDPKKGAKDRQPTKARERNVGHPLGEEHNRRAKGNRGVRRSRIQFPEIPYNNIFTYTPYYIRHNGLDIDVDTVDNFGRFKIPNININTALTYTMVTAGIIGLIMVFIPLIGLIFA